MKSFLQTLGRSALMGAQFVPGVGKIAGAVAQTIPAARPDDKTVHALTVAHDGLAAAMNLVAQAERQGLVLNLTGEQKAAMLGPDMYNLMLVSAPVLAGKKPKDLKASLEDAAAISAAIAKFLNGFDD